MGLLPLYGHPQQIPVSVTAWSWKLLYDIYRMVIEKMHKQNSIGEFLKTFWFLYELYRMFIEKKHKRNSLSVFLKTYWICMNLIEFGRVLYSWAQVLTVHVGPILSSLSWHVTFPLAFHAWTVILWEAVLNFETLQNSNVIKLTKSVLCFFVLKFHLISRDETCLISVWCLIQIDGAITGNHYCRYSQTISWDGVSDILLVTLPEGIFMQAEGLSQRKQGEGKDKEANDPDDLKDMLPDFFLITLCYWQPNRWLHLWRIKRNR